MKTTFGAKNLFFVLLLMIIGFTSCDKNDDIKSDTVDLKFSYQQLEGEEIHATIRSIKTGTDMYSCLSYTSEAPLVEGFVTSYVLKSVKLEGDENEVPLTLFDLNKETGVLNVKKAGNLKPGIYALDIQVNTIGESTLFPAIFKFQIIETGIVYDAVSLLLEAAMSSSVPVFTGGFVATAFKLEPEVEGFAIDATTGVISTVQGHAIAVGEYALQVLVTGTDCEILFPNAINIKVEKEIIAPSQFAYEAKEIEVGQALTVTPTVTGTDLVFALAEGTSDQISLDAATGVISLLIDNTLVIGTYEIEVIASNSKGDAKTVFSIVIKEKPAPVPANLLYDVAEVNVSVGKSFTSAVPSIDNGDGVIYALTDTQFAIDAQTGVISLAEGNTLTADTYNLAVIVTYADGQVTFDNAFTVTITSGVIAPADLVYVSQEIEEGDALSVTPTATGTDLLFELEAGTSDQISINASTGEISLLADHTLTAGDYAINITASNSAGSVLGTLALKVNATAVLTPPSNLVYDVAELTVATWSNFSSEAPTLDNGTGAVFSIDDDVNFKIDSETGVIKFADGVEVAGAIYTLTVTATTPGGQITTPYSVSVSQMVYPVNPLNATIAVGATSVAPTMINADAGGTFEIRGVHFTGTIDGTYYEDVLIEGGKAKFIGDVIPICTALNLVKSSAFNTNLFRDWMGVPPDGSGNVGKGVWDGAINVKPNVFIAGKYSLKIRYKLSSGNTDYLHAIDILIN